MEKGRRCDHKKDSKLVDYDSVEKSTIAILPIGRVASNLKYSISFQKQKGTQKWVVNNITYDDSLGMSHFATLRFIFESGPLASIETDKLKAVADAFYSIGKLSKDDLYAKVKN